MADADLAEWPGEVYHSLLSIPGVVCPSSLARTVTKVPETIKSAAMFNVCWPHRG